MPERTDWEERAKSILRVEMARNGKSGKIYRRIFVTMSFRTWMYAVAFGLALTGSGQAQQETQDEQGQASEHQSPAENLPIPLPVEIVEDQSATDARQAREDEANQRQIDDLIAQEGMNAGTQAINAATEDMRDYAYVQTWLVGIGTVLLFVTLILTLMANKAAQAAVEITRTVGGRAD